MGKEEAIQQKIFEAANKVFACYGFDLATMTQIAQEAKISRTSLNYYYRTKERLFLAIHEEAASSLGPKLRAIIDSGGTILEKMPRLIDTYLEWMRLNSRLPVIANIKSKEFDTAARRRMRVQFGRKYGFFRLMRQFRREVKEGKLRQISFAQAIILFHGLTVFPFMAQEMVRSDWTGESNEAFEHFVMSLPPLVTLCMRALLDPSYGESGEREGIC